MPLERGQWSGFLVCLGPQRSCGGCQAGQKPLNPDIDRVVRVRTRQISNDPPLTAEVLLSVPRLLSHLGQMQQHLGLPFQLVWIMCRLTAATFSEILLKSLASPS